MQSVSDLRVLESAAASGGEEAALLVIFSETPLLTLLVAGSTGEVCHRSSLSAATEKARPGSPFPDPRHFKHSLCRLGRGPG